MRLQARQKATLKDKVGWQKGTKIILIVGCLSILGCSKKTLEDCILENIDKAHTNISASMIEHICEEKYGVKKITPKTVENFGPAAPAAEPTLIDPDDKKVDDIDGYVHDPYDKNGDNK